MRTTKPLLTLAIIAALPFAATAENISGAMYTAPATADTNHPAPTTQANASYGRINIDTADQEHIATTAYVKGAYNSAIAAVNKVAVGVGEKQDVLTTVNSDESIQPFVIDEAYMLDILQAVSDIDMFGEGISTYDDMLITAKGAAAGITGYVNSKGVEIYTTWDDDDATTDVALKTVLPDD